MYINKCLSLWGLCAVTHAADMRVCVLVNVCPRHVLNHICMSSYCPGGVSYSTLHLLYITSSDGMGFA